jgi:hypothetical protein
MAGTGCPITTLRKLSGVPQSPVPNPLRKTDDAS